MNSRGGFIVIEGPDGCGKSTQIGRLCKHLKKIPVRHKFIHFPRYNHKPYGALISLYLNGAFGKAQAVNPYLASLLYACDRKDADRHIRKWVASEMLVISDRYYLSNLAYQGAKIAKASDRERFASWLYNLEFRHNRIIKPDLYIYLDVPTNFILANLNKKRHGTDRDYLLRDCYDIHEKDTAYQAKVIRQYKEIAASSKDVTFVRCYTSKGDILSPEDISEIILDKLQKKRFL